MYRVSTQGIDERMINVHYYYYSHKVLYMSLDLVKLLKHGAPYPWCYLGCLSNI